MAGVGQVGWERGVGKEPSIEAREVRAVLQGLLSSGVRGPTLSGMLRGSGGMGAHHGRTGERQGRMGERQGMSGKGSFGVGAYPCSSSPSLIPPSRSLSSHLSAPYPTLSLSLTSLSAPGSSRRAGTAWRALPRLPTAWPPSGLPPRPGTTRSS